MMKKLFSFVCCLLPFSAGAAPVYYPEQGQPALGPNNTYGEDGNLYSVDVGSEDTLVVRGGKGIVISKNPDAQPGDSSGLTVANGLVIGAAGTSGGFLYADMNEGGTANTGNFTILSAGDIRVGVDDDGNPVSVTAVKVKDGYTLGVATKPDDDGTYGSLVDAAFGKIQADGALNVQKINAFKSGNVTSATALTIGADTITAGAINVTGGTTDIEATGALTMAQFQTAGTTTNIDAGSIESGNIQNNGTVMKIAVNDGLKTNDLSATSDGNIGSIQNLGQSMIIEAGSAAVDVAGTLTNASGGALELRADSLIVNGGNDTNPSLVNAGNLNFVVDGTTRLVHGFDVSTMGTNNTFFMETGSLQFGSEDGSETWVQDFANNAKSFELSVTKDAVTAGNISNGAEFDGAKMTIKGLSVSAKSVTNEGNTLLIQGVGTTEADTGSIYITEGVQGAYGSVTTMKAGIVDQNGDILGGVLNVAGTVSNSGDMQINGNNVTLGGVANSGKNLAITALTSSTGSITINSAVTNGNPDDENNSISNLTVNAREIDIKGIVTNYYGTTTINGSDKNEGEVLLGGIDVKGGVFNLDALVGVSVTGAQDSGNGKVSVEKGGVLNIGSNTYRLTAYNGISISGNVYLQENALATGDGDVSIAADGSVVELSSTSGDISIAGDVTAIDIEEDTSRTAQFIARQISVDGNVDAAARGKLIFGQEMSDNSDDTTTTIIGKTATASDGGGLEFYSTNTIVGGLVVDNQNSSLIAHGNSITASVDGISIGGDLWFNAPDNVTTGMIIKDTNTLILSTASNSGADIDITGNATITAGNTLQLLSDNDVKIGKTLKSSGVLSVTAAQDATFNSINNSNSLTIYAKNIKTQDITNTALMNLGDEQHAIDTVIAVNGGITNSGDAKINAKTVTVTGKIESKNNNEEEDVVALTITTVPVVLAGGDIDENSDFLQADSIDISGGVATLNVGKINVTNNITTVAGDLVQAALNTGNSGRLNIVRDDAVVRAKDLTVGGAFNALNNSVGYELSGNVNVGGAFDVKSDANVTMIANGDMTIGKLVGGVLTGGPLTNAGGLTLGVKGADGLQIGGAIENTGNLSLLINDLVTASTFVVNTGTTTLMGKGMTLTAGDFGAEDKTSALYHGIFTQLEKGDFRIVNSGYTLTAANVALDKIVQSQDTRGLIINTSNLQIANDIDVADMRVAANPSKNWLQVDVGGNVFGGAQFIGLKSMHIGKDYTFTNNSQINAAILPYASGDDVNSSKINYWSTVSLNDDNTLGQITNKADGAALIQVDGAFVSSADAFNVAVNDSVLGRPQVGLVLNSIVDPGTAIWLLHADGGVSDTNWTAKIRNLSVSFCNADGTKCFDYLGALDDFNGTDPAATLPAYISVRDSAGDGFADSLYVVFDPRFGGPVEVFKIQPIVERVGDHTDGEYGAAGALDDLIAGQLFASGFYNRTPIEAIPLIFENTNLSTVANELYKRMEQYNLERDGAALARFSRLFQPREVEQLVGNISLNEHTNFRSFEDRMFDEFIWNRHRNLKKAWVDVDYGMFYQDATDGMHVNGNRFNITGGFDWQENQTLLLGVTGRISRMSSDSADDIDLGYLPGQHIAGHVKTTVSDTDIGLGAYLMKILGQKTRIYGNGFLDIHVLNVDRDQTYVSKISGSGTAISLMSEWGLLHDWLNQYIVGNMYARVGYTSGFDITEKAAGQDYMKLKSDGYFSFTPGYSLTAQKRIYPSVWFQVRPYATIGVEYDVLGAPDSVKYKFAAANKFTSYDINIDPLWANIGGGVEMLSVTGIQVGIDYRYQYNSDMQLHNIRLSGSYRF